MAEPVNLLLEKAAPVLTYGGGSVSILSGLSVEWIGVLIGVVGMVGGLALTWYFKKREAERDRFYKEREDARQQARHDLAMILRADRPERLGDHQDITEQVVAMEDTATPTLTLVVPVPVVPVTEVP